MRLIVIFTIMLSGCSANVDKFDECGTYISNLEPILNNYVVTKDTDTDITFKIPVEGIPFEVDTDNTTVRDTTVLAQKLNQNNIVAKQAMNHVVLIANMNPCDHAVSMRAFKSLDNIVNTIGKHKNKLIESAD